VPDKVAVPEQVSQPAQSNRLVVAKVAQAITVQVPVVLQPQVAQLPDDTLEQALLLQPPATVQPQLAQEP